MLRVTLYSDFTCPYCYLVERSSLPRLGADFGGIEIDWQPFEVEPDEAPEGLPPQRGWYEAFAARAHELGLTQYQVPRWVPATAHIMALAEYARAKGRLDALRAIAMRSYWEEQGDLDGDQALGALAAAAGLTSSRALAAARSKKWQAVVRRKRTLAVERGVHAVPAVDFGGVWVVGAQDDGPFWRAAMASLELQKGVAGR